MAGFKDPEVARQAGRKSSRKGSPNKVPSPLKTFVSEALEATQEQILKDLAEMEPAARVNAWLKMLEFALPKQRHTSAEISGVDGMPIQTQIVFTDSSQDEQAVFLFPTAPAYTAIASAPRQERIAPEPESEVVFIVKSHQPETPKPEPVDTGASDYVF